MARNNAKLIVVGALVMGLGLIATRAVQQVRKHQGEAAAPSASAAPERVSDVPAALPLPGRVGTRFDPVARKTAHFVGASEVELQTRHGVGLAFVALERERSLVFRIDSSGEVRGLAAPAD